MYNHIFSLLLLIVVVQSCHPECSWECDDPICPAHCVPVVEEPKCEVHCNNSIFTFCEKPRCSTDCPENQCEADTCPACETKCHPLRCRPPNPGCVILCEAIMASWKCSLPTNCPYPTCKLMCEKPACEFSEAMTLKIGELLFLAFLLYIPLHECP